MRIGNCRPPLYMDQKRGEKKRNKVRLTDEADGKSSEGLAPPLARMQGPRGNPMADGMRARIDFPGLA